MRTTVRKLGKSLGLVLSRSLRAQIGVQDGSLVELTVRDGEICIRPVRPRPYPLKALLEGIREGNLHGEMRTGRTRGREVW